MSRALLVLSTPALREKAAHWARIAPEGSRVTFQGPKRTLPQNDRQWWLLTLVATQKTHAGRRLQPEQWKRLFLDLLNRQADLVPSLEGDGFVNIGNSSSDLSTQEHSDFTTIIEEWAARHGVVFPPLKDETPVRIKERETAEVSA